MNSLAPIVLFVYNRPVHTLKLLESLRRCTLSNQSRLIVYADGPKQNASETDIKNIIEVRRLILDEKWCMGVQLITKEYNLGLADSIVNGVTEVLNHHDKIIVLEDDLILAPGFLNYMNDALNIYDEDEKVMHISGYMYPVKIKLPETFFMNSTSCWGWATWKRAWKYYNLSATELLQQLNASGRLNEYSFNNASPFYRHLEDNVSGKIKTWAIKWNTSVFLQHGFCLHPRLSLVRNTGNDESGTHGSEPVFNNQKIIDSIEIKKIPLIENVEARKSLEIFYFHLRRKKSIFDRLLRRLFNN